MMLISLICPSPGTSPVKDDRGSKPSQSLGQHRIGTSRIAGDFEFLYEVCSLTGVRNRRWSAITVSMHSDGDFQRESVVEGRFGISRIGFLMLQHLSANTWGGVSLTKN